MIKIMILSVCILAITACSSKQEKTTVQVDESLENVNEPSLITTPSPNKAPTETFDVDPNNFQSDPVKVVQSVFDAAKNKDFSKLALLKDPMGENDEPTTNICSVASLDAQRQAEFVQYFGKGKVVGEARINKTTAEVSIKFGPDGTMDEIFVLVNRRGYWYLGQI